MKAFASLLFVLLSHMLIGQEYSTPIFDKGVNINGIETNDNDDIFIVGSTYRATGTGQDVLVVCLDKDFNLLYDKIYGGEYQDIGFDIAKLNNGNFLISGESWRGFNNIWGRENPFYAEIDPQGEIISNKSFYLFQHDAALSAKATSDGNILLVGTTRSHQNNIIEGRIDDILLLKSDMQGNKIWDYIIPSQGNDYASDFIEDNGDIVLVGALGGFFNSNQADGRYNHDSQLLIIRMNDSTEIIRNEWGLDQNDFPAKIIKAPDSDDFFVVGSTQSYGEGSYDIVIIRFDNNLNELWHKTIGGSGFDYGNDIALSKDNNSLYILGTHYDTDLSQTQSLLTKMDLNGIIDWRKQLSIGTITNGKAIALTHDNQIIIAGEYGESMDSLQLFVSKYNEYGDVKPIINTQRNLMLFPNPIVKGNLLHFRLHSNIKDSIRIEKIDFFTILGEIAQSSILLDPTTEGSIRVHTNNISFVRATLTDGSMIWSKIIVY